MSGYPADWNVTVVNGRVRIEYQGANYYTSALFRARKDTEGIRRENHNTEALATYFRFAIKLYGHPFADDNNPAPPIRPEPELTVPLKKRRW
jgi:hypothetical protein